MDTREPSETADEMIVSPNPPKPGTGTKKKKTATATAAKRDTPTSTRRRRERDQGEKQDGDDGDDNGDDNDRADGDVESADPSAFTLPTLPKPTKPMTRDEYAEYLLAEMRLEEVVLQKAQEIKANLAKLKVPPQPEPKRTLTSKKSDKTHWESLLLEMNWLAKEFQRERRWKLNTARRGGVVGAAFQHGPGVPGGD